MDDLKLVRKLHQGCVRPIRARQARDAYDRAIELAGNTAEVAYLARRRDQLSSDRR